MSNTSKLYKAYTALLEVRELARNMVGTHPVLGRRTLMNTEVAIGILEANKEVQEAIEAEAAALEKAMAMEPTHCHSCGLVVNYNVEARMYPRTCPQCHSAPNEDQTYGSEPEPEAPEDQSPVEGVGAGDTPDLTNKLGMQEVDTSKADGSGNALADLLASKKK